MSAQLTISSYCVMCGGPLAIASTGRPRRTCSDRCRQQLRRRRVTKPATSTAVDANVTKPRRGRGSSRRFVTPGVRTRRVQALELLAERPMTIPELAEAMGVLPNYLYRVIPHLANEGHVRRDGNRWLRT